MRSAGQGLHSWTCKAEHRSRGGGVWVTGSPRQETRRGKRLGVTRPCPVTAPWNEPSPLPGSLAPLLWWGGHRGRASGHDEFYGF